MKPIKTELTRSNVRIFYEVLCKRYMYYVFYDGKAKKLEQVYGYERFKMSMQFLSKRSDSVASQSMAHRPPQRE